MTRAQQVRQALDLLDPADRQACKEAIEDALVEISLKDRNFSRPLPKNAKRLLKKQLNAIQRLKRLNWNERMVISSFIGRPIEQQLLLRAPSGTKQRAAVRAARLLLTEFAPNVRPTTHREGRWCQLAAILYSGKSKHAMDRHCIAVLNEDTAQRVPK